MESQKITNLLDHKDDNDPIFETKKWYIINDLNNGQYGKEMKMILQSNFRQML